jgi:hypothetical protein
VTALLLLHLRQGSSDPVQNSFDIYVNLPIPFVYLTSLDWCDRHNAGIVNDDIDTPKSGDSCSDERFHFSALCNIDGEPDSLSTCGRNLFYDRVDSVLPPRSQYDSGSVSGKKLGGAFSNAAAGSGDDYDLVLNI